MKVTIDEFKKMSRPDQEKLMRNEFLKAARKDLSKPSPTKDDLENALDPALSRIARKGWLTKSDVINCLPLKEVEKALKR